MTLNLTPEQINLVSDAVILSIHTKRKAMESVIEAGCSIQVEKLMREEFGRVQNLHKEILNQM